MQMRTPPVRWTRRSGFGMPSRQTAGTLKGHNGRVNCVTFSPNGNSWLWARGSHRSHLLAATGASLATLTGHTASIYAVAYLADARHCVRFGGRLPIVDTRWRMATALREHTTFVYLSLFIRWEGVASASWAARSASGTRPVGNCAVESWRESDRYLVAIHPAGGSRHARESIFLWDLELASTVLLDALPIGRTLSGLQSNGDLLVSLPRRRSPPGTWKARRSGLRADIATRFAMSSVPWQVPPGETKDKTICI